jgi:hypothetical protein
MGACGMVGCIMLFSDCEDGVKGVFKHNLWLDCSPEVGVNGI